MWIALRSAAEAFLAEDGGLAHAILSVSARSCPIRHLSTSSCDMTG
jgi:hypothetical protein